MSRCVVVAGADIHDYEWVISHLNEDDFFVYCDCGLRHMEKLGRTPGLIVGDFDSYDKPSFDTEIISLPTQKDDTDTFFAVKEMLKRGYKDFVLLGVIGNRFDHTMANISILLALDSKGCSAVAVDDYSVLRIVSGETAYIDDNCSFFSIINISGVAKGITIEDAKYCLKDGIIECDYQYGVSNEVLPGKTAKVSVKEGRVLLVIDR